MSTTQWLSWTAAILAHAAMVGAVASRPGTPVVEEPSDFSPQNGIISTELMSDLTEFEPRTCPVHHVEMQPVEVPIAYGELVRYASPQRFAITHPNEPSESVRDRLFPWNDSFVWGGCCVNTAREVRIYHCPECERAEKEWRLAREQSK